MEKFNSMNIYSAIILTLIFFSAQVYSNEKSPLSICLDVDSPPYSYKKGEVIKGIDVALSNILAKKLDRELNIIWFETENERESNISLEVNALLSNGECELVGGYALFDGALKKPALLKTRMPDIDGAPRKTVLVELGELAPSIPYIFAPFTVVLGSDTGLENIEKLNDLESMKIAALQGTLPHLILMSYQGGYLRKDIHHLQWVDGLFGKMESGLFNATLTERHKFETYKHTHPDTKLKTTDYQHSIGFNIGFVTLKEKSELLSEVNFHIKNMIENGELEKITTESELSYVRPTLPYVLTSSVLFSKINTD